MRIDKLISKLEILQRKYGNEIDVKIGMRQRYGTDFAMNIGTIDVHLIKAFYGNNFKSIVIEESGQIGAVDWDDFDVDEDFEEDED